MKNYLVYDLGGTFIKYALMNEEGSILEKDKREAPVDSMDSLKKVMKEIAAPWLECISGAALSLPGRHDTKNGFSFTGGSYRFIREIPLEGILEDLLGVPVTLANDGRSAAAAEVWKGSLCGIQNGAVIVLGTGTGGGIVLNGKIFNGSNFGAGELSLMPCNMQGIADHGMDMHEHVRDLWFAHASATGLIGRYAEKKGLPYMKNGLDGIRFFEAYDKSDPDAAAALEEFGRMTAAGILSLQAILDLETIAIGGGISARKEVTDVIRRSVNELFHPGFSLPFGIPEIVTCHFRADANLIGALYFHLKKEEGLL